VLEQVSGRVLVELPGSKAFTPLSSATEVPLGSTVDARHGRLTLQSAADTSGKSQSAQFRGGLFRVGQVKLKPAGKLLTTLRLTQKLTSCSKQRHLWGSGKGNFRTIGIYSSATVQGTQWLVKDTCSTTTTVVARGTVTVRDYVRHANVTVTAGHSYRALQG
jgi:hypothetical protein